MIWSKVVNWLNILIFKQHLKDNGGVSYCHYDFTANTPYFNWNEDRNWYFGKEAIVHPSTKEERDLLFAKMKEAGYEWDAEKKELKKIEQKSVEWSEEDERIYQSILDDTVQENQLCDEQTNWLKSLKDRVLPQSKQEWSEEDESVLSSAEAWLDTLCDYLLDSSSDSLAEVKNIICKLKSLEERCQSQPKQEWSEEDENGFCDTLWAINQARSIAKDENDMGNLWYAERWIKSLKDRVLPQPKHEWSEEDKKKLSDIIVFVSGYATKEVNKEWVDFLKSLRPQKQWKPSEEQITWLYRAADMSDKDSRMKQVLNGLLEQLKAL